MLLEAILDDRQHALVDEPAGRVLHHALLFREQAAHVEEIGGVERGSRGLFHGSCSSKRGRMIPTSPAPTSREWRLSRWCGPSRPARAPRPRALAGSGGSRAGA